MDAGSGAAMGGVIGLLLVALMGLIIGAIAKLLMPGPDAGGWFVTILLGIAGSWVGAFAFGLIGLAGLGGSLIGAVLGAMLLLFVYRLLRGKKSPSRTTSFGFRIAAGRPIAFNCWCFGRLN